MSLLHVLTHLTWDLSRIIIITRALIATFDKGEGDAKGWPKCIRRKDGPGRSTKGKQVFRGFIQVEKAEGTTVNRVERRLGKEAEIWLGVKRI